MDANYFTLNDTVDLYSQSQNADLPMVDYTALNNSIPTPLRNIQERRWYEIKTKNRQHPPLKSEPYQRKQNENKPHTSTSCEANRKRHLPQEWGTSQQCKGKPVHKQHETSRGPEHHHTATTRPPSFESSGTKVRMRRGTTDQKCDDNYVKHNSGSGSTKEFQEGNPGPLLDWHRGGPVGSGFDYAVASPGRREENEIALHSRGESRASRFLPGANSQREGKATLCKERSKSVHTTDGKRSWRSERCLNSPHVKIYAASKQHGKDDCDKNYNMSSLHSTSSISESGRCSNSNSSSDSDNDNDADGFDFFNTVSKSVWDTPSKKMRVTVNRHKDLQDNHTERNSAVPAKSQLTEGTQLVTLDGKTVSISQQKRIMGEENHCSYSGTPVKKKKQSSISPCKNASCGEKNSTDTGAPVNKEEMENSRGKAKHLSDSGCLANTWKEEVSTSQHKNSSCKEKPRADSGSHAAKKEEEEEPDSTSQSKKASSGKRKPQANSGSLANKNKKQVSTSQRKEASSGKGKSQSESGTPVNKEGKEKFTSQPKKARVKKKHCSDPDEKLACITHNEACCDETHSKANDFTLDDYTTECNIAVKTLELISKPAMDVVFAANSTTEMILNTSKTEEEGSFAVARDEKVSDKSPLQDDIDYVNSFQQEAIMLNNSYGNPATEGQFVEFLVPHNPKHFSLIHRTSPENPKVVPEQKILHSPCASLEPLASHIQVLQQQQQELDQRLTTGQQRQPSFPISFSSSPQQPEEFFNPHEPQDVLSTSVASQQPLAAHQQVQQQQEEWQHSIMEHQGQLLPLPLRFSSPQQHPDESLRPQELQHNLHALFTSQQPLAVHHQVQQQQEWQRSLTEQHQVQLPLPVPSSLPQQPEEFFTPQELQTEAPLQPSTTNMSERDLMLSLTQRAATADIAENFTAPNSWAQEDPQHIESLETEGFSQTLLAMVKRMILCCSCKTTFNRSVICHKYVIQLNRPIQCACGCVMCKSCYYTQKGCSVHNVSSDRGLINTTANTLASCSELETMKEWDLVRDLGDQFRTEIDSNQYVQQILKKEQVPSTEELQTAFGHLIQNKDTMSFRYWENEQMLDEVAFRYVCIPHVPGFWDHVLVGACPLPKTEKMIGPDYYLPKLFNVCLPNSYRFHWCCFVLKKQVILAMWCTVCATGRIKVTPLVDCVLRNRIMSIEFRRMVFYLSRWFTAQYVSSVNRELKVVLDSMPSEGPSLVHLIAYLAHKSGMDGLIPQVYQIRPHVDLNYNFNLRFANKMFTCPCENGANGDYVNITDEFNSFHNDSSACTSLTRVCTTTEYYNYL